MATLASLSLTPLSLSQDQRRETRERAGRRRGERGGLFSAPLAEMPSDFPERLALALLDVAGAAPQIARHVTPGDRVVVLGAGGKSGLLCCAEARRRVGSHGTVLGIEANARYASDLSALGLCDQVINLDATEALRVREAVVGPQGREADLTISCLNVAGAEPTAILLTRPRGRVYFFAMSTSFTAAALGAEGMGKDIDMYIGNGYADGHAEHTLELVRSAPHCGTFSPAAMPDRLRRGGRRGPFEAFDDEPPVPFGRGRDQRILRDRKQNGERGPRPFVGVHLDRPPGALDKPLADGQTEPGPLIFGGVERDEQIFEDLLSHAGAAVGHPQFNPGPAFFARSQA